MYSIYVYHYCLNVVVALCKPYIGMTGVFMTDLKLCIIYLGRNAIV